jgi:glutamine phosphoribosylpyrophosphate amidotransferase
MCGIVGFYSKKPTKKNIELLHLIIQQSKIRGLHSFGYSYYDGNIKTIKQHNITDIDLPVSDRIIFHNRYATSGDYLDHNNNQPISVNDMSLVFNGVIDMRTKDEMQEIYNIEMQTENDGELVIQLCGNDKEKIIDYIKKIKGSFAGLIMMNNKMYAIRNKNRPAWKLEYNNATYIASTKDIFKRVNEFLQPVELTPYQLYEF